MARHLIVAGGFEAFQKGDRITDPELVEKYLESHRAHVLPITVEDPAPAQKAPKAPPAAPAAPAAEAAPDDDDPGAIRPARN